MSVLLEAAILDSEVRAGETPQMFQVGINFKDVPGDFSHVKHWNSNF